MRIPPQCLMDLEFKFETLDDNLNLQLFDQVFEMTLIRLQNTFKRFRMSGIGRDLYKSIKKEGAEFQVLK